MHQLREEGECYELVHGKWLGLFPRSSTVQIKRNGGHAHEPPPGIHSTHRTYVLDWCLVQHKSIGVLFRKGT